MQFKDSKGRVLAPKAMNDRCIVNASRVALAT
jgi:hypothetical protein